MHLKLIDQKKRSVYKNGSTKSSVCRKQFADIVMLFYRFFAL
jgi:hypothetical protein